MFEEMQRIYNKDGQEGVEAWYESLSQEEKDLLRVDWQERIDRVTKAFESFKQAVAELVPHVIEILQPLINAYMEANPGEFERLARKERSQKRYERMVGGKSDI